MDETTPKPLVGFLGTGVMGRSMAGQLLAAGYRLHVHSRTRAKAEALLAQGATWADSPADLAARCQIIVTIVGFPQDVEDVYFKPDGLIPHLQRGTILVDMTTSKPELAGRIAQAAATRGGQALDAPVSGGDTGARTGTLSIMVGGDRDTFKQTLPLLRCMGKNIVYQGPAGSGQACKMCNQITIAATMVGVCEALAYAKATGLDPQTVLQSISAGAAGSWTLSNLGPRILAGDFDPGFYVKHFIKDMTIASQSAQAAGVQTPGLDLSLSLYEQLAQQGGADDGTQALFRLYAPDNPEM